MRIRSKGSKSPNERWLCGVIPVMKERTKLSVEVVATRLKCHLHDKLASVCSGHCAALTGSQYAYNIINKKKYPGYPGIILLVTEKYTFIW